ncbi:hypothetical protein BGZ59_005188 [Podila verticillata]|nr:hypothetical protein BGZ59_005188 [Podila verticillata]
MKRAIKSFFGIKKKSDPVDQDLAHHGQENRSPSPSITQTCNQQVYHSSTSHRNDTRPLSHPNNTNGTRSLQDIKVYEERLQNLESRIAVVTEQLSHKIHLHSKAREQELLNDEYAHLQSPTLRDEAILQRRKDKGKSRKPCSPEPDIPSSLRPTVPQKSVHRRSTATAIDIPRSHRRESFVYSEDSFFDSEDYASNTTDIYHLSPRPRHGHNDDAKHIKDKDKDKPKPARKPVKSNAKAYLSHDTNVSSSKNHAYSPKDRIMDTNKRPTSTKASTSAPWQPHQVSPSQVVTTVSSTGSLFGDHISPPSPPSKSRLSLLFGDRPRHSRKISLPWPIDHAHITSSTTDGSLGSREETTAPVKTPIASRRASIDLDNATENTVSSTKTARHPVFHEDHIHVHTKVEDDDIQKARRVVHPYRDGIDTDLNQSSMIMEPRSLSSRDPSTLSSPTSFVAPGSPPQRLRSPIAIAASPRANYLLSTSPISTVSSEQGTRRFSNATSRGTARRIIYSAELEQGRLKGHIPRESNYEVVGYGQDGSPSPSTSQEAYFSTRHVEPATIVVRPGKGASQVTIRANSSSKRKHGHGHGAHVDNSSSFKETGYTSSRLSSSMTVSRISNAKKHATTTRRNKRRSSRRKLSALSIRDAIVQMTSSVFAEHIRAQIHAFLFQDSPRTILRKRNAHHHRHCQQHDHENTQAEIETFSEISHPEDHQGQSIESVQDIDTSISEGSSYTEDEEYEDEEEGFSARPKPPPYLGTTSPPSSSQAQYKLLQPMRARSLYSVLRRISPTLYEQEQEELKKGVQEFDLLSILDVPPLHTPHLVAQPYNMDEMFPMGLEDEVRQDEQEQEEEKEPMSDPCPDTSHMGRQLHENDEEQSAENNTRLALKNDDPSPSRPVRPVLINGLTCEELIHSIRFESDREGSPGYYGPAEYQRDETRRLQRELEEREALKKRGERKRSGGEASSEGIVTVVAKVGGALTMVASTAWHTTSLVASRIPITVTTRTHAVGSTTMGTKTTTLVEEE